MNQKQRRWGVGTGRRTRGQQGKIRERAGEQAEASCQHEETAKNEENRRVSQQGAAKHRMKGEGIGSRRREKARRAKSTLGRKGQLQQRCTQK